MWDSLFGPTLLSKDGSEDTVQCIDGAEYVMIYISAHWCGPCRAMTPKLATAFQRQTGNARVIFLSLDNDQTQFEEYFQTMPWHAVQYEEDRHNIINELSEMIESPIKSIPARLVFDTAGNFITSDGCSNFGHFLKSGSI